MRRAWLGVVVACVGLGLGPVTAAHAAETCGGRPVTIAGTDAAETVVGTEGDDVISGGGGSDVVLGLGGNDVVCGDAGSDQVGGGPGDDVVIGGPDGDLLGGGQGNDLFVEEAVVDGADAILGFTGHDTLSYEQRTVGVTVRPLFGPSPTIEDSVSTDVEEIVGGRGDDRIEITTAGADNVVRGGPGNDTIDVTDGVSGNDKIFGGDGSDSCRADRGDVRISCP